MYINSSSRECTWGGGSVPALILEMTRSNAPLLSAVPAIWLTRRPLYQVECSTQAISCTPSVCSVLVPSSRPVTTLCSVVRFSVLMRFLLRRTKHFVCALIPARYQNCAGARTYALLAQDVEGAVLRQCSRWNAFEISDIQGIQLSRPNPVIR